MIFLISSESSGEGKGILMVDWTGVLMREISLCSPSPLLRSKRIDSRMRQGRLSFIMSRCYCLGFGSFFLSCPSLETGLPSGVTPGVGVLCRTYIRLGYFIIAASIDCFSPFFSSFSLPTLPDPPFCCSSNNKVKSCVRWCPNYSTRKKKKPVVNSERIKDQVKCLRGRGYLRLSLSPFICSLEGRSWRRRGEK